MVGAAGLEALAPSLRERLADPSAAVRRYAARSLGQIQDRDAVAGLLEAVVDEDPGVREEAAGALSKVSGEALGVLLVGFLTQPEDHLRGLAVAALRSYRPRDALEPLLDLLGHHALEVRRTAADLVGYFGDPRAVEELLRAHDRDWPEVQRAASASLVRLGFDGARQRRDTVSSATSRPAEASTGKNPPLSPG
jgi:HEAT repeat protein